MKLLYVCSAGMRRSAALAAYTEHFKEEYKLHSIEVSHAAASKESLIRDSAKIQRRLRVCERTLFGKYREETAQLRDRGATIHPRIGVLLLKEGVDEIIRQQPLVATRDVIRGHDLVLAAETGIRNRLRQMADSADIYTVKEFLGHPAGEQDIPDIFYKLPFTWHQLLTDRKFCDELRAYACDVLSRLSAAKQ